METGAAALFMCDTVPNSSQTEPRFAAVRRILQAAEAAAHPGQNIRSAPAKVYPALNAGTWVVEAPACPGPLLPPHLMFAGEAALTEALEYAHSTYGGAQYLSR